MTKHEKIYKKEDGTQYKIEVDLSLTNYIGVEHEYNITLRMRLKRKRVWKELTDTLSDWEFRTLSMEDRRIHVYENIKRHVPENVIRTAKLELWQKLKPT